MKGTTKVKQAQLKSRTKEFLTKERHVDSTLFLERMHEWDQEFARQKKQLAALTRRLRLKQKR